ncbi:hypothetical protein KSS87_019910 [Heliosperma pusillum]|nr:hypothetical protein KSS87_019910 [Heliosperma pusillum]
MANHADTSYFDECEHPLDDGYASVGTGSCSAHQSGFENNMVENIVDSISTSSNTVPDNVQSPNLELTHVSDESISSEILTAATERQQIRRSEYNASVEFDWAPYLLESSSDDIDHHVRTEESAVRKDSINTHGDIWKGADIIVFSTYSWKGSFSDENKEIEQVLSEDAYRMAIEGMLTWVDENVDPKKTRVFFRTMTPSHRRSTAWGGGEYGDCWKETTMIEDPQLSWVNYSSISLMQITSEEFSKKKAPISFLNITQLSAYRKDAHVQTYHMDSRNIIPTPEPYVDCLHWCLPGLPDTWNELLFAQLFYPS